MTPSLSHPSKRLAVAVALSLGFHAALLAHLTGNSQPFAAPSARWPLILRIADSEPAPLAAQETTREEPAEVRPAAQSSTYESRGAASDSASDPGLLPELEHYYRGSEVDRRAEPLSLPDIEYPQQALASGMAGRVTLRLLIDRRGLLRNAEIVEAIPAGIFEEVALSAVHSLSFRPALRDGQPVGSIKLIEVPFYPDCQRTGSCVQQGAAQADTQP